MAQANFISATSAQFTAVASITTPSFAAAVANDVGLIFIVDNSASNTWNIPAGWTSMFQAAGQAGQLVTCFYKVLTGSETTITVTRTGTCGGIVAAVITRNVDITDIVHNFVVGTQSTTTTSHTTPGVSVVPANSLNIGFWGHVGTASTNTGTAGTNFTERLDHMRSATPFIWMYVETNETLTGTVSASHTTSVAVTGSEAMIVLNGVTDSPPTFSVAPSVSYSAGTQLSSTHTASITTTVTDDISTGANALTYAVRTSATVGGGSLVTSGTLTHNVSKVISLNNTMTTLTTSGDKTVYLQVTDGGGNTIVSSPLTVSVDVTAPSTPSSITNPSAPILENQRYYLTFTGTDTQSTAANEMTYEIRTAASGGGTLIKTGTYTSASANTGYFYDDLIVNGSNTRWVRIIDGGGNVAEASVILTATISTYNIITTPAASADDAYFADGNSTLGAVTRLYLGGQYVAPYLQMNSFIRFVLNVPQGATINSAFLRLVRDPTASSGTTINSTINAYNAVNAAAPTTYAAASGAARTTASVTWNHGIAATGDTIDSPDITAIVQEIVNKPGWVSGQHIIIFVNDNGSAAATYAPMISWDIATAAARGVDSNDMPALYVNYATSQTYTETGSPDAHTSVITGTIDKITLTETATPDAHTTVQSGADVIVLNEAIGVTAHTMVTTGTDHVVLTETSNPDAHTLNIPAGAETANVSDFTSPDAHTMVVLGPVDQSTGLETASPVVIASVTTGSDLTAQNELSGLTAHTLVTSGAEVVIRNDLNVPQTFVFVTTGSVDQQMSTDTTSTVIIVSNATYDIEVQGVLVDETTTPMQIVSNLLGSDVATFNADVTQTQIIVSQTIGPVDRVISTETGSMVITSATPTGIEFILYVDLGSMLIVSNTLSTLEQFGVSDIANTVQIISVTPFLAETVVRNDFNPMVMVFNTPAGFETSSFTDFTNTVVMVMTFAGVDIYSIGLFEHYQPQALVVLEPYTDSTLMVLDPYQGMITVLDPYEGTLIVKR